MSKVYPTSHMFGDPDLRLTSLKLWVLARERPEADDYYDGNWLHAHARVETSGAIVEVSGPWLRSDDLAPFLDHLLLLQDEQRDTAELSCMEPGLHVEVRREAARFVVVVNITPDHLTQMHRFEIESDAGHLRQATKELKLLLDRFPVMGTPPT